jgi:peptidoglycan-associated lipoprotein
MKRNGRLALGAVVLLSFMLFTVSCTKNVVQSEAVPTNAQPEVSKAVNSPSPETEQPVELQKEPLPTEQPASEAAVTEEPSPEAAGTAFDNENVHFAFDSSILSDQARQILNNDAEYLRTYPETKVTVQGYCDERGTGAYNLALGQRRAEAVKQYLVVLGITADRLQTISYGEERPIDPGHNEAAWAKNRRAQFILD